MLWKVFKTDGPTPVIGKLLKVWIPYLKSARCPRELSSISVALKLKASLVWSMTYSTKPPKYAMVRKDKTSDIRKAEILDRLKDRKSLTNIEHNINNEQNIPLREPHRNIEYSNRKANMKNHREPIISLRKRMNKIGKEIHKIIACVFGWLESPANRPESMPEDYYTLTWRIDDDGVFSAWSTEVRAGTGNVLGDGDLLQLERATGTVIVHRVM